MGHLTLIIGCMFSQKTTELMRRIRRYNSIGYKILTVNFINDTRYGTQCIASHDHVTEKAINISKMEEIDALVRSNEYKVIAIDEGQFFTDLHEYVTTWADQLDVHIVVAGLDGDAERRPFGDMLRLIPHAEEVERLNAYCSVCSDGTVAIYSRMLSIANTHCSESQVLIGAAELYQPVCRKHYLQK